ncbi:DUF3179 domain-containing protein [Thioalkalivibrio paradoxus]|uniref:DUF3179 domain-containing protein n=1 Tax=Thioalkalivibrio paradoxus ARh 1 TaxID=713585 RepID=W0DLC8_9GAMM|nr:DUF3179 domain-containing protein [Thioalkalivibrio paradoxus]AHE98072.1 hypothetical protein THITH_07160 [Thioalkalivibrio paradoxus ARh 1]
MSHFKIRKTPDQTLRHGEANAAIQPRPGRSAGTRAPDRAALLAVGFLAMAMLAFALFAHGCSPNNTSPDSPRAQTMNGFDVSNSAVPLDEIHRGGPPRDGIPALTDPEFIGADGAHGLRDDDRVLGVFRNGVAKAYPLGIMNYHEVVNDLFGAEPIAVTYCPLCFTGIAFQAEQPDGSRRTFGVSGLLYNSDVLLYDRETESLWSQIAARAITGPLRGETLEMVPLANTTWEAWHAEHPDTRVLSRDTDYARNYDHDPYAAYAEDEALMFPVRFRMQAMHPKTPVLGVRIGDHARAYPFAEFPETGRHRVEDTLGGEVITLDVDADAQTGRVFDSRGEELTSLIAFWFAWFAFHPETERYTGDPPAVPIEDGV